MSVAQRPASTPLAPDSIAQALQQLNQGLQVAWNHQAGKITKDFAFKDFSAAFAFMTRVAMLAEQLDHHPEWSNVYRHVTIALTTHDAKGLSALDFTLAQRIEVILRDHG
jgi:4a-hydroxytetrahydrobiopterin dehydratase